MDALFSLSFYLAVDSQRRDPMMRGTSVLAFCERGTSFRAPARHRSSRRGIDLQSLTPASIGASITEPPIPSDASSPSVSISLQLSSLYLPGSRIFVFPVLFACPFKIQAYSVAFYPRESYLRFAHIFVQVLRGVSVFSRLTFEQVDAREQGRTSSLAQSPSRTWLNSRADRSIKG